MCKPNLFYILPFIFLTSCSDDTPKFPSPEGMHTPYILKEDCTFSIVEERSKASVSSPKVEGLDIATFSSGASLGDKSITVTNCKITENSHDLPIYEN